MTTKFIHEPKTPQLFYTPSAWQDLWYTIKSCPKEVGWMGFTEVTESGDFLVTSIFIPKQKVSGAETDIDKAAMAEQAMQLLDDGAEGQVLMWGHSHVNMGTSPSGQDNKQLTEFLSDKDIPYFIRCIYNKRGDSNTVIYEPHKNIWHANVTSQVTSAPMPEERKAELDAIFLENVKEATYNVGGYHHNYRAPYGRQVAPANFDETRYPNGKKNLASPTTMVNGKVVGLDGRPISELDDSFDDDEWFRQDGLWPNLGLD